MNTTSNPQNFKQTTLWCLPYDTETYFKEFLKISFSRFLKQLVSNKYFPQYEKQMIKELNDKYAWNDKCWNLLQFFQFLNASFQISQLDIIVSFIEEEVLRKVMGHFRLWIDLERLYLFNFLKLDRMQFMDDRIYMTLYRTMLFLHTLFSEYDYQDFHPDFIKSFCAKSIMLIDELSQFLSKATKPLAQNIKTILSNYAKKSATLISQEKLEIFKREVKIRIVQQAQTIGDIQDRLYHNVKYQQRVNDEKKMKMILEMSFIDGLTKEVQLLVDPKKKIVEQYQTMILQTGQKENPKELQTRLNMYEQEKNKEKSKYTFYQRLQMTSHDPYDDLNQKVYGSLIKIDSTKKNQLVAKQEKQVISKKQSNQLNIYYEDSYIRSIEQTQQNCSKVTWRDLARKNGPKNKQGTAQHQGDSDQNKIFNLRYTFNQNSRKSPRAGGKSSERDFDNNILFKNEIDEYLENSKIQMLHRFAANKCQTKTFMEIKNKLETIFPKDQKYSFGCEQHSNREPLYFSVKNLMTVNRNKFDQMRKIISYMTAQKKIKNLILQKNIPESYPRNFSDIKILSYNPLLTEQKINYCSGKALEKP